MKIRLTAAAAGAALAIAAFGAGGVLAGDPDQGPGQDPADVDARVVRAHPIADAPSAPFHARAAAGADRQAPPKRTKPELIYLETDPLVIPPGPSGQVVAACPGASKAINGYYFIKGVGTGFGLANEGDSPAGLRRWSFYLNNTTEADLGNVTFGMVCIKGVR